MTIRIDRNMATRVEQRVLRRGEVGEVYLTATPAPSGDLEESIRQLYGGIRDQLAAVAGRIVSERLFACRDVIDSVEAIRVEALRDFDDGVSPTRVIVSPSVTQGRFAGAQVHAIFGPGESTTLRCWSQEDGTAARIVESSGDEWVFINGMSGMIEVDPAVQAERMFVCAGCLLSQAGATMKCVPRTWLWLKDVCSWYDEFNSARTSFFEKTGLINVTEQATHLPASTGIGLHVPEGSACTLDLIALPGRGEEIQLVEAGGDQRSAFEYGSAFSRASVAPMPGGKTVFISGTAAIDESGETEFAQRVDAQIDATIAHVRSLLADLDCGDEHVLTALVYCKDGDVERSFRERWGDLTWPRLTMIGDVCRPDLFFEVEVTASPDLESRDQSLAKSASR